MSWSMRSLLIVASLGGLAVPAWGSDPTSPNRVPVTRPEMKQALEDLKKRTPRIPPPELTEEEKEKLGDRANSYEGRLRARYMPSESRGGGEQSREPDPNASLSYEFKTRLFWIVSRLNNCHY